MTSIPREITAGDSLAFTVSLSDYPAPDWQLHYTLFNASEVITLESAADDADHAFSLPAATTATWVAGRYDWTAFVTGPDDARQTLGSGSVIVRADPATMTATDGRSHARRMLEAIEATMEGQATGEQLDTIRTRHGDRDWQREPERLMDLYQRYKAEVRKEDQATALANGEHVNNRLKIRFQ